METTQVPSPLERAEALQPLIREHAAEAQRNRRLSPVVIDALHDAGLFRMCLPREFGGEEVGPWETVETIAAVSYADGSTGWNFMIGSETNGLAAASVPKDLACEVFAQDPYPHVICGGSVGPAGRAEAEDGGWRVSGQFSFVSGCHQATYFFPMAQAFDNGEPVMVNGMPLRRVFMLPLAECEILDTWDVAGMRGSGSHDVKADGVLVPLERASAQLGQPSWHPSPIFHYPYFAKISYNKVAVGFGVAQAAIDHFLELAATKQSIVAAKSLRDQPRIQYGVAEAQAKLRAGRAFVRESLGVLDDVLARGDQPSMRQIADVRLACAYGAQQALAAVEQVCALSGTSYNRMDSPLEVCLRDARIVPGHFTASPALYEPVGQTMLGIDVPSGVL